jgi:hypothetical protein
MTDGGIDRSDEYAELIAEVELPEDGLDSIPSLPSEHYGEERQLDPPAAPLPVASTIYADFKTGPAQYTLKAWRGGWMLWLGTHWDELDEAQLRAHIYRALSKTTYEHKTKNSSPNSAVSRPSKHPTAKQCATDSTAAATATPTAPCTSSASFGYAATNPPATTSPAAQPKAKPKPKSCAASSDTSPARSTAPSKNPAPKPLPQHRRALCQAAG